MKSPGTGNENQQQPRGAARPRAAAARKGKPAAANAETAAGPAPPAPRQPGLAPSSAPPTRHLDEGENQQKAGSRSSRTVATRGQRIAGGKFAYIEPPPQEEEP